MASAMYRGQPAAPPTGGVGALMTGGIDLDTDTMVVIFLRTSAYTFSQTHDFFDDLQTGTFPVGNSGTGTTRTDGGTLGSVVVSSPVAGVFDAADETITSVTSSTAVLDALAIYKSDTNNASSELLAYVDGFSITPNGGDITIQWDAGTNRIFRLVA